MQFGDKDRFAITLNLDEDFGGAWLFGRVCYWIQGSMVGNYDEGTSLRDVLFQTKYILGDSGKRFCPALIDLDKEKTFALIDAVLYGGTNETDGVINEIDRYISSDFLPAVLNISVSVDVFDSWKIFLIEDRDKARILYRKFGFSSVEEVILKVGEFDKVFEEAYRYLDCLYEREISLVQNLKR
ncbi:Imm42 family immunity protein [Achromobacter ruhlandii]|uniref:Imm42 family immunity protein n=1 Tax=Achromobacter ruhlandii TaxID=72557 RepID=UPI00155F68A9|nr:Imm42 family immunity protein [Achromobacter ruhlandii]